MSESAAKIQSEKYNRKQIHTLVDNMTLFDDDLMSRVFDQNIEATELVLGIILGRKIRVISVIGQDELKNHKVGGRNITLDIHAMDENGEEMDLEVQGNADGAHVRRARYHSSMMDAGMLKEGQNFKEMKDSYVIFLYKHDKFQRNLPVYHIERCVKETEDFFRDGSHIIYVNGNYRGEDAIGYLIEDFQQTDPEKIHYKVLAKGVKHFKKTGKGSEEMCEAVEAYAKEYAKEYAETVKTAANVNAIKKLIEKWHMSKEDVLEIYSEAEYEMAVKELQQTA